jgi:branched-chain amino acid transport system permease protein
MLAQQLANGISTGLVYGLLALGFSLAYSATRVVNFAHGEFFTLGALLGIWMQRGCGFSLLPASLISVTAMTVAAGSFAFFILWWLRTPLQRTVATIAVSLGLRDAMLLAFGSDSASFPQASAEGTLQLFGVTVSRYSMLLAAWTVVLLFTFWFVVTRTRLGIWMRATAQDPELAATNGVVVRNIEAAAFALGAFAAVAAGLLIGPSWQVSYSAGSVVGVKAFTSAMLGGLGRLDGAVAGGVLLGVAEALFAGYVSSAWKDLAVFLVLLVTLLFLPRGLFSLRAQRLG